MTAQKSEKLPKPVFIILLIMIIPVIFIIVFAGAIWFHMLYVSDVESGRQQAVTSPIESYLAAKYPEISFSVTVRDSEYGKGDKFSGFRIDLWEEPRTYLPTGRAEISVFEDVPLSISSSRYVHLYTFQVDYDIESMTFSDNHEIVRIGYQIRHDTQNYIYSLLPDEFPADGSFENDETDIPLSERSFETYLKTRTLVISVAGYDYENKHTQTKEEITEFTEKYNKILEEASKSGDVFGFEVRYEFLANGHVVDATKPYTEYDSLYQYYTIKNGISDKFREYIN